MTTTDLSDIDYSFHARMIRAVLDADATVAICEPDGRVTWINNDDDRAAAAAPGARTGADPGTEVRTLDDGRSAGSRALRPGPTESRGWIVVIFDGATEEPGDVDRLANVLADICGAIADEIELRDEIEELAGELAQRYEELSLIYETDDGSEVQPSVDDSLQRIAVACISYPDIDTALLLLPERKLWVYEFDAAAPFASMPAERLKPGMEELFHDVGDAGETLVLNKPAQSSAYLVDPLPPSKLIACPVLDALNKICGVLACLKRQDKPDFLTSERKLIEVMSKHVSKVVVSGQDVLTGLMNRPSFEAQIQAALTETREGKSRCVVALLAIDQFGLVNDAHGVRLGDEVLKQFAELLKDHVRERDTVARMYGDQFGILFSEMQLPAAQEIVGRLCQTIARTNFAAGDAAVTLTTSIGLVALRPSNSALSEVLTAVDIACQTAKELGGNRIEVFQPESTELLRRRGEMRSAAQIDAALKTDMFELFCQPIMPLHGSHVHFEILLRLRDAEDNYLTPASFMQAAERYNRMPSIDRWVLQTTLRRIWEARETLRYENVSWGINLSGQSLADSTFMDFVVDHLEASNLPPEWLYFEVTETVAIRNLVDALRFIGRLKDLGYAFALDDFGSGYSSCAYLKQLPVSYLKIDGAFIKQLDADEFNQTTVSAMHQIAQCQEIETIAEFVETPAVLDMLYSLGVNFAQGYGVGKPRPLRDVMDDLRKDTRAALDQYIYSAPQVQ